MMRHLIKLTALLTAVTIALSFAGCDERKTPLEAESSKPEAESVPASSEPETASDEYYPHTAPAVWLDGGETLAVPDGNIIRYLNLNNRMEKTVELPEESLIGDFQYFLTSNRIFVMGGYDGENYPGSLTAFLLDGKWEIANGSIFDGDGKLLRAFPRYTETQMSMSEGGTKFELSDGRILPAEGVEQSVLGWIGWVTDDLVVLDGNNRLFFYRLSTDTLTLADDMSDWMEQYGKFAVYYGVDRVFPYGEGAFYFAHKNEEKANNVGTVWYADETGTKELFEGQEFQNCMGNEEMLVLVAYEGETEDEQKARVSYARTDDLILHALDMEVGWVNPSSHLNGTLAALEARNNEPSQSMEFYALDVEDGSLARFVPPQAELQCELLDVSREADGLQYIYSGFDSASGTSAYYRHHAATKQTEHLRTMPRIVYDQNYSAGSDYYIEYAPDFHESTELRIHPM